MRATDIIAARGPLIKIMGEIRMTVNKTAQDAAATMLLESCDVNTFMNTKRKLLLMFEDLITGGLMTYDKADPYCVRYYHEANNYRGCQHECPYGKAHGSCVFDDTSHYQIMIKHLEALKQHFTCYWSQNIPSNLISVSALRQARQTMNSALHNIIDHINIVTNTNGFESVMTDYNILDDPKYALDLFMTLKQNVAQDLRTSMIKLLTWDVCPYCQQHFSKGKECENLCEYGKAKGHCIHSNSIYKRILRELNALEADLDRYWNDFTFNSTLIEEGR